MLTMLPYRAGQDTESVEAMEEMINAAFCMVAISVPTNVRELNIPQGAQVISPRYGEDYCFEAAQVLEDAFVCPNDELLDATL